MFKGGSRKKWALRIDRVSVSEPRIIDEGKLCGPAKPPRVGMVGGGEIRDELALHGRSTAAAGRFIRRSLMPDVAAVHGLPCSTVSCNNKRRPGSSDESTATASEAEPRWSR